MRTQNQTGPLAAACPAPAWLGGHEPYGVTLNEESVGAVFARYERCGFLYPAKRAMLAPYLDEVTESWRRTLTAPARVAALHHCMACVHADGSADASVSYWRSGHRRFHSQHLVSRGRATGSRQVLLAAKDTISTCVDALSVENWFREDNRFPARVFGTVPAALGPGRATIERRELLGVERGRALPPGHRVRIARADDADGPSACAALARFADPVIAGAEELDSGDIEMAGLDASFARLGTRRYRRVFVATIGDDGDPVGIASAYRGPLGLNFSFLENRCDLWIDPGLSRERRRAVASGLLDAACPVYDDLPLPRVLVACDAETRDALGGVRGAEPIRAYLRCVWLRDGFWDWYRHVDSFYARVLELERRRNGRAARAGRAGVPA